jgi:ribosomal protein S18 acetylase RimI-like enzyme
VIITAGYLPHGGAVWHNTLHDCSFVVHKTSSIAHPSAPGVYLRKCKGKRKMNNGKMIISIHDALTDADQSLVSAGHTTYEQVHGIDIKFRRFALLLHDDHGTLCGALQAYTAYAEIYVDDLWVEAAVRRRGYGRQLLTRLEHEFVGTGYHNINLVTNAFQAPDFYVKCGYSIEFVRINTHNPLLTKTFFVKYLSLHN